MRERYEILQQEHGDVLATLTVKIQELDAPSVSSEPVSPFKNVLKGVLAGLMAGLGLAIFFELFSKKVRFKQDIIDEFGIPVVGVLPKR